MDKLKRFSNALLIVATVCLVVFLGYDIFKQDKEPPVINIPTEEIEVSVKDKDDVLLEGVTAKDNRDGDVSDSVVIEKISSTTEEGYRIITYAAIDRYGNVGRTERKLTYNDYKPPVIYLTNDMRFQFENYNANPVDNIKVESELDGDLTKKVKINFTDDTDVWENGTINAQLSVTDSTGTTAKLPVKIDIYDGKTEGDLELSQYIVYLEADSEFSPMKYYNDDYPSEEIKVESNVDMKNQGVYDVVYTLDMEKNTKKARLVVVVL